MIGSCLQTSFVEQLGQALGHYLQALSQSPKFPHAILAKESREFEILFLSPNPMNSQIFFGLSQLPLCLVLFLSLISHFNPLLLECAFQ